MGQMRVRRTGPWVKISCPFSWVQFIRCVGHGVGQAVDPHFDPHHFQRFCNKFATKKHRKPKFSMLFGAGGVTRTHDLLITNQLLYRLSYTSTFLTACTFYHMSPWMSTKKFDDYYLFSCMKKCRIPAQAVDFFRFLSVVQNLHCYTTPKNTRCFRLSRPRRRSKFLHFRDNVFT